MVAFIVVMKKHEKLERKGRKRRRRREGKQVKKDDVKLTLEDEANADREANDGPRFDKTSIPQDRLSPIHYELFDQTFHSIKNHFNTPPYLVTRSGASNTLPSDSIPTIADLSKSLCVSLIFHIFFKFNCMTSCVP